MAILNDAEIQTSLSSLYKAKQALFALDKQFNDQAAAIMDKAKQEVEALRVTFVAQRQGLAESMDVEQKKLEEGK